MGDADSNSANQRDLASTSADYNGKPKISGNQIKERIEQIFEIMLGSLSSSDRLFVDIASRSSSNANVPKVDIDGLKYEKRPSTKISFPGKNENEAWRFGNVDKDDAIDIQQL